MTKKPAGKRVAAPARKAPAKKAPKKPKAVVDQSAEHRSSKPKVAGSSPAHRSKPQGKRVDWEAVERDYRAGKLTLREMATKHGCTNGRICQVAKERHWVRGDLQEQVKKATQALLIEQEVSSEVSRLKQGLSETVVAAAEVNRQVIVGHRTRVKRVVDVAMQMLEELETTTLGADKLGELFEKVTEDISGPALASVQQQFRDMMRLHNRIASAQKLMVALKDAQALEAQTYGNLYDGKKTTSDTENLTDDELEAAINERTAKLGGER